MLNFHLWAHKALYLLHFFFWGELIDKYKDINANSKTVFADYAMLKLVPIVPICFYYSVNQRWAWLKKNLGRSVSYKNDHEVCHIKIIM